MKLSTIIFSLRQANTYFGAMVGGAADFGNVQNNTLNNEVAFVIPLGEVASSNDEDSSINQKIEERFGVICVLKNDTSSSEKTGILAYDKLESVRNDLIRILINYDIGYETSIEYLGARLLEINAAWLWYQYEFVYKSRLVGNTAGEGIIEYREVGIRKDPLQIEVLESMGANYKVPPFLSFDANQPVSTADDPNPGDYDSGFTRAFKILLENEIRR